MAKQPPMLAGWGRVFAPGRALPADDLEAVSASGLLFRGLGRSYGDAALPAPGRLDVIATAPADRVLALESDGVLRAEAGLALSALNAMTLPRGFFVPVTPGTHHVTLGGMVAADVHGKNHHVAGTIGAHVRRLRMRVADGRVLWCGPTEHVDLFDATLGGMGLTGAILEVELQLAQVPSPWIHQVLSRHDNLADLVAALGEASATWPMTMAWVDCLRRGPTMGRGVLYRGRWASKDEAPTRLPPLGSQRVRVPFAAPAWALSPPAVRLFNEAVFRRQWRRRSEGLVGPGPFFYPLDVVGQWNLGYGRHGLTQHQAVIPREAGPAAVRRFLEVLTQLSAASFLCVIKDCGAEGRGTLSFPRPGTSIAVDLPVRRDTPAVIARLNAETLAVGGRIYLAKDQFTTRADFEALEPRLAAFTAVRDQWDPRRRYRSAMSVRLLGDAPFNAGSTP